MLFQLIQLLPKDGEKKFNKISTDGYVLKVSGIGTG